MIFEHERHRFLHDVGENVRGVAGETAMPAVSSQENRVQSRTGRPDAVSEAARRVSRCCRAASDWLTSACHLSAPAHQSHQAAAHPPHLITFINNSRPLVASSSCSHAKQARGRIAVSCNFYTLISDTSRSRGPWATTHAVFSFRRVRGFTAVQAKDSQRSTNLSAVLLRRTHLLTLLRLETETKTLIGREMHC